MEALEIGHFGRIAGLDQRLEPGLDQVGEAAAQHGLLAEQVGLAFLAEIGLDDARTAAADARGIGERDVMRVAARVLVDRDQAGHAAAADIFAAHGVAGALGRDHDHVDVGARLDQPEMDVEAMREGERGAGLHIALEVVGLDRRLMLVGREDHEDVGPVGGFGVASSP